MSATLRGLLMVFFCSCCLFPNPFFFFLNDFFYKRIPFFTGTTLPYPFCMLRATILTEKKLFWFLPFLVPMFTKCKVTKFNTSLSFYSNFYKPKSILNRNAKHSFFYYRSVKLRKPIRQKQQSLMFVLTT